MRSLFQKIKKIFSLDDKNTLSILLSIIILVLVFGVNKIGPFYALNKDIQYSIFNYRNYIDSQNTKNDIISDDIVVVEIDNKTLETKDENGKTKISYPLNRLHYIPVIENLKKAGASIIALDIIFTETKDDGVDTKLQNTIKDAGNIIIGSNSTHPPKPIKFRINNGESYPIYKGEFKKSIFHDDLLATGYFSVIENSVTQVVDSILPFINYDSGDYRDHFSFSILKVYYGLIYNKDYIKERSVMEKGFYKLLPGKNIPLASSDRHDVLINYIKRSQFEYEKNTVSFIDIFDDEKFEEIHRYKDFKDKIVLIGFTADGVKDIFSTPNGREYGVYTHANMINTVLKKRYYRYFESYLEWVLIFFLIIVSVYFNLSRSGYILAFSNIAIFALFLIIFPALVITSTNLIINYPIELIFALILSFVSSNIIKYLIEYKHKQKLNKALSEYVSEDIASEILSGAGKINLDGETKKVSVFFSDIEGFTNISEKFSPEDLVKFLREYLKEMSDIILDEKGFINKYEGDAIMALWGVFGEFSELSVGKACKSALLQQKTLSHMNIAWKKKGLPEIKARIGIHIGNAIIGNIGSEGRKMEFTALGDTVNLASRLEGVNKFYGTYVCVSEDVFLETKNEYSYRYLDKIRVKGKDNPVVIYELLGEKGSLSEPKKAIIIKFTEAISLYLQQDFEGAKALFEELEKLGDAPSKTYVNRCNLFIDTPMKGDWDGVWTMDAK